MLKISIEAKGIERLGSKFASALSKAMQKSAFVIEANIKKRFGTPGNLKVRTGKLRRSIRTIITDKSVSVGTNVVYAPIHEYGGIIRPKNYQYLTFKSQYGWIRAKKVTMPARPFMKPGTEQSIPQIKEIIVQELIKAWES